MNPSEFLGPSDGFVKTALPTGVAHGVLMSLFWILCFSLLPVRALGFTSMPPLIGVAFGVGGGVLFGGLMGALAGRQGKGFASQDPCAPGETPLKRGPTNHFLRGGGVGGYPWLTDGRLLFRSHRYNGQNHDLSIPPRDVEGSRPHSTAGSVPTGLEVVAAGRRGRFVVEDRRDWAGRIRAATEQPRPSGGLST